MVNRQGVGELKKKRKIKSARRLFGPGHLSEMDISAAYCDVCDEGARELD